MSPASLRLGPHKPEDWKPWLWEKRLWASGCQRTPHVVAAVTAYVYYQSVVTESGSYTGFP